MQSGVVLLHLLFNYYLTEEQHPQAHVTAFVLNDTSALLNQTFCYSPCDQHHILQPKYCLQCKIHWACPCISHLFFTGTCHLLVPLQIVVLQTCSCPIDMQRALDMTIFCQTAGYGSPKWHLLVLGIVHLLVFGIYHLWLGLSVPV